MSTLPSKDPHDLKHFEHINGRWVEMGEIVAIYRKPTPKQTSDDVTVSLADDETYKTFRNLQPGPERLEGV